MRQMKVPTTMSSPAPETKHISWRHLVAQSCATLLMATAAQAENLYIEHVTLIDGIHAPQRDMTVAVEGDKIATLEIR